ncbi:MAG: hypothetical protein ABI415_01485 [Flavitalea sp.]
MNGRQWEVNFRRLPDSPNRFYADTPTLDGERIQFYMNRNESSVWELSGSNLPQWFKDSLSTLATAVEKGMAEYYPQIWQSSGELVH